MEEDAILLVSRPRLNAHTMNRVFTNLFSMFEVLSIFEVLSTFEALLIFEVLSMFEMLSMFDFRRRRSRCWFYSMPLGDIDLGTFGLDSANLIVRLQNISYTVFQFFSEEDFAQVAVFVSFSNSTFHLQPQANVGQG